MSDLMQNISEEFKVIGRHKYNKLKSYDFNDMTAEQMVEFREVNKMSVAQAEKEIEKFEAKHNKKDVSEKQREYFKRLRDQTKKEVKPMTKAWLYRRFKECFFENEGKYFRDWKIDANNKPMRCEGGKLIKEIEIIENIKPLIYYFIGDFENFKKCKNVSKISEPSFNKGLLIVGGYGNGKTSVLSAFEKAMKESNFPFTIYTANNLVKMYEQLSTPSEKREFDKKMLNGVRMFDDVLTERDANNYGKSNLIKDILEERYSRKKRTYLTINYKDSSEDLNEAINQIGERYGGRLYDRVFDMFNVITFKGNSFRK